MWNGLPDDYPGMNLLSGGNRTSGQAELNKCAQSKVSAWALRSIETPFLLLR
jgi:hypothetical protein